ncbi:MULTISPECIES: hypothetical protein [Paenibacillus]|uniref:hypothetical protein n=1 Tax=Paenibacillus TaxID=44249 RepID=UPI00038F890A|nr:MULTISPECIES: hypothetical protein [Paenibacillus]KKC46836.1 hypothetical protein VE23_06310 [Paenibacillus sp. D9]CDN45827.1 Putative uncharacterized protein [Paenibacillus sp. P22]
MSKLDGNERWKSKMLLTEHVEQYDGQHSAREAKVTTAEERVMIRDYILLPHMEKMVQKSLSELENSSNLMRRLYGMAGHRVLDRIMHDLYALRRELKARNIRILAEEQSNSVVYHRYYCRGYEEHFGMTREVMRSEISWQLSRYTAEIGELLKGGAGK